MSNRKNSGKNSNNISSDSDRKMIIEQLMYRAATDSLDRKSDLVASPRGKVKTLTRKAKSVILRPKKDKLNLKTNNNKTNKFFTGLGWKYFLTFRIKPLKRGFYDVYFRTSTTRKEQSGSLGNLPGKTVQYASSLPNTPLHSINENKNNNVLKRKASDTPPAVFNQIEITNNFEFEDDSIITEEELEESSSDDGITMVKKVPLGPSSQKQHKIITKSSKYVFSE